MRKYDCSYYGECLTYAAKNRVGRLPCEKAPCKFYESESRTEQEWPGLVVLALEILQCPIESHEGNELTKTASSGMLKL